MAGALRAWTISEREKNSLTYSTDPERTSNSVSKRYICKLGDKNIHEVKGGPKNNDTVKQYTKPRDLIFS